MRSFQVVLICLTWLNYAQNGLCQTSCPGVFDTISASDYAAGLSPGWNLGNTLDAFPNEDSWNNPAVTEVTFDDVKAFGFKSVRIPSKVSTRN